MHQRPRDLIAALREEGLIAAGPRSPKLGAPYAYVTTEKFLFEFGFESLRDLPDPEALKDAGLLSDDAPSGEGDVGSPEANAVNGHKPQGGDALDANEPARAVVGSGPTSYEGVPQVHGH